MRRRPGLPPPPGTRNRLSRCDQSPLMNDGDEAGGVVPEGEADRAETHPRQAAAPAGTGHQKLGLRGCIQRRTAWAARHGHPGYLRAGAFAAGHLLVEGGFGLAWPAKRRHAVGEVADRHRASKEDHRQQLDGWMARPINALLSGPGRQAARTGERVIFGLLVFAFIAGLGLLAAFVPLSHGFSPKGGGRFFPELAGGPFTLHPLLVALPWAACFVLGLLDWHHPWRVEHLDLLALAGFFPVAMLLSDGIGQAGLALAAVCLGWLFVRMLG